MVFKANHNGVKIVFKLLFQMIFFKYFILCNLNYKLVMLCSIILVWGIFVQKLYACKNSSNWVLCLQLGKGIQYTFTNLNTSSKIFWTHCENDQKCEFHAWWYNLQLLFMDPSHSHANELLFFIDFTSINCIVFQNDSLFWQFRNLLWFWAEPEIIYLVFR